MPRISIIIPTYNAAKYICETVDSVLAQTYKDYEIIIIDDGSKDNTKETLSHYGNKIKYVYQKNAGVSAARNNAIRLSQGEYLAFLDSDDIWLPHKLATQIALAEQNPEVSLIFSDAEVFNDSIPLRPSNMPPRSVKYEPGTLRYKIADIPFNNSEIIKGDFYKDLLIGCFITVSTVLLYRKCLNNIDHFDENITRGGEDYDMWLRISENYPFLYINEVTTRYRERNDSMSGEAKLRGISYKLNDIEALRKQLKDSSTTYKAFIRERILECYKIAIWGYFNFMDLKKVRTLCLESLHLNMFQMKLYLYLVATFFPSGFIKSRTPFNS